MTGTLMIWLEIALILVLAAGCYALWQAALFLSLEITELREENAELREELTCRDESDELAETFRRLRGE